MSCLGRKHQFPRNFLCRQAPGCIQVYSFKSMIVVVCVCRNAPSPQTSKRLINGMNCLPYLPHYCQWLQQKRLKCNASSGHTTKQQQSIFSLDIYALDNNSNFTCLGYLGQGNTKRIVFICLILFVPCKQSSQSKGISETNLKLQIPCSKCMHQPVMSQADACTSKAYACKFCMHCPMMSQANACSYCRGSVVLILSWI